MNLLQAFHGSWLFIGSKVRLALDPTGKQKLVVTVISSSSVTVQSRHGVNTTIYDLGKLPSFQDFSMKHFVMA